MQSVFYMIIAATVIRNAAWYWIGFITPGYSLRRDFISETMALDAPHREIATLLGVVPVGVLLLVATPALYRLWARSSSGRVAVMIIAMVGLANLGIAAVPCDPGCPHEAMGTRMIVHMLLGLVGMALPVVAALFFAFAARNGTGWAGPARVSLILGLVGLLSWGVFMYLTLGGLGFLPPAIHPGPMLGFMGLVQRVLVTCDDLFIVFVAGWSVLRLNAARPEWHPA